MSWHWLDNYRSAGYVSICGPPRLVEGCAGAKGTPLSMWQVRVWWTGWMEIASGPESVFMSSCQSTDRPAWPEGQAQVWSRHPQSGRLAVPNSLLQRNTQQTTKNMGNRIVYVSNTTSKVSRLQIKSVRQGYITWLVLFKYSRCEYKITTTSCKRFKSRGPWDVVKGWRTYQQNLLLSQQKESLICCNLFCALLIKTQTTHAAWIHDIPDKKKKRKKKGRQPHSKHPGYKI